jgi:hypothetical protein
VKPAVPADVRAAIKVRSGGLCEAQLRGCLGRATDCCHRIARKAGGRPGEDTRLSNVWHGCRACHRWATENPIDAYARGLALKEHEDSEDSPMTRRCERVYLYDDGSWTEAT